MLSNLLENKLVLSLLVIIPVYVLYFHDWEDTFIKEQHQAGDPETYFVRIYEFVTYLVRLFGVALFWNISKTM